MDLFDRSIPNSAELIGGFGAKSNDVADMAISNGDSYGMTREQLEQGFSADSFAEAGQVREVVGRLPTKRIDA